MGGRKEPGRQRAALRSRSRGSGARTVQPLPPGGSIDQLWRAAGGVARSGGVVRGVTYLASLRLHRQLIGWGCPLTFFFCY